tara:strand:- start:1485 stop:1754 length:270 start_codon:yes stop_codon:yes gene_type:complete
MAKGKAAKSESGASMSQYDVEVEARLQALEKAVKEISAKCDARASGGGGGNGERVDKLIDWMTSVPAFANEMPVHYDEETGLDNHHLDF